MAKIYEVNASGLRLREAPVSGEIVSVLDFGTQIDVLDKGDGDWWKIETSVAGQPVQGFVASKFLREASGKTKFTLPFTSVGEIKIDHIKEFAGRASDNVLQAIAPVLNEVLKEFGITKNPRRLAHFAAQLSHESGGFTMLEENLNYSGSALWRVFRKYFDSPEHAEQFARQPEKIANRVYGNRMGNGDETTGDGWRYRGRGFIQLTGKNNYRAFGDKIGQDLVADPDKAAEPVTALKLAAAFWEENGLNALADKNDLRAITKRINGGFNGLEHRIQEFDRARAIWGAAALNPDGSPKKPDRGGVVAAGTGAGGAIVAGAAASDIIESEGVDDVAVDINDVVKTPVNIPGAAQGPRDEVAPTPTPTPTPTAEAVPTPTPTATPDLPEAPSIEDTTPTINTEVINSQLPKAVEPGNRLELWILILGVIIMLLAIYLAWNRISRRS